MPKCLIVSNRLPLYFDEVTQSLKSSSGGLVSALKGVQLDKLDLGIEWLAPVCDQKLLHEYKNEMSASSSVVPIEVEQKQYEQYYNFYANKLLWALFHYERPDLPIKIISWDAYQLVNQQVANMIAERAQPDDLVWVHDYHLMLVPELIKQHHPQIKVGFFLHIPFPHYEFFREIPQGADILRSLKSCDLIGFHDGTYLNYYQQTVERMHKESFQHQQLAKAYPISIDTPHFTHLGEDQETILLREKYKTEKNGIKWILGVDRLDLIKGLLLKLDAFKLFLTHNPNYHEKVQLLQVIVPSRTQVEEYQNLKTQIEQMISQINGEFSTPTWMPIKYLYHSVTENELCALYQSCEVLFISSKRDGMNLVSLEYIACQTNDDPGIVVLSEFAGASSSLPFALKINPWDIETTCKQLVRALEYPLEERRKELKIMKFFLESYTSTDWATSFIHDLINTNPLNIKDSNVNVDFYPWLKFPPQEKAMIFCDFDGTLAELVTNPDEAKLSHNIAAALKRLEKNKNCELVIISGRDRGFLEKIFISQGFQFSLVACHGAYFYDAQLKKWEKWISEPHYDWKDEVINTMESFCQRTPGSFLEIKEQSIVWHFRNSPSEFASTISQKLFYDLQDFYQNKPLKVSRGKKIIEVHPKDLGKGKFLETWLRKSPSPTTQYFALGDDQTDEDMFEFLQNHPEISSYCIKVGPGQSKANYQISDQAEVEVFLNYLSQNYEEYSP